MHSASGATSCVCLGRWAGIFLYCAQLDTHFRQPADLYQSPLDTVDSSKVASNMAHTKPHTCASLSK